MGRGRRNSASVQAWTRPHVCGRPVGPWKVSFVAEQCQGFPLDLLHERPPASSPLPISSQEIGCSLRGDVAGSCLGRWGRETWERQTLLSSPSGSSQVSGPSPVFTDSQEIQEIRGTWRQASGGIRCQGAPPHLPSAFAPSLEPGSPEQRSQGTLGSRGLRRG